MPAPYVSNLGHIGYAKESAFGAALAATDYVPFEDESIEKDPGLVDSVLMRASRDVTYKLPGEQKIAGGLSFPLFSVMGMGLVVGGIGSETATTGSTPTNATTLAAASVAGATTISTTATFAVNDIVQVDSNASNKAECRKVTAVAGAGPFTLTLDSALVFAHANAAAVAKVVAPFTHTIALANSLPSFTIEKNLGGLTALQYAGVVVDKFTIKGATNSPVQAALTLMAQKDAQIAPTTAVYTADLPITLAGVSATLFSAADANVETFELSLENGLEPHYTFSGQRYPTSFAPTTRKVSLKITEVLPAMTYYNNLPAANTTLTPPAGNGVLTLTAGADVVTITLPQLSEGKLGQAMKAGKAIMQDVTFDAWLGSQANVMSASVVNSRYLNF